MTVGKKKLGKASAGNPDPKDLPVAEQPADKTAEILAHISLEPALQAALTLMEYNKSLGEMPLSVLVEDLKEQCRRASRGETARAEELLTAQAHTLDGLFNSLARRAALNMGQYVNAAETYLRLALKAQSQCRTTWETLAEIKNPRSVAFVRQANLTTGPQQVNNGPLPEQGSRARENEIVPNKLLEQTDGERLDFGAAGTAGRADPRVAAVEEVHRPEDRGWKSASSQKR